MAFKDVKVDPDHEERFTITLTAVTIRGKQYGSAPTIVSFGNIPTDATAVCCDGEKWVDTRENAAKWLIERGLSETEADLLISLGEAVDKTRVAPLAEQEAQGQVDEEVQKIADGTLEDIKAGLLKSRAKVRERVEQACGESGFARDLSLAANVIRFTNARQVAARKLAAHILFDDSMARLVLEPAYKKLRQ